MKTILVKSAKALFDSQFPIPEFRDLHVSIEFPIEEAMYPGIWVDFEPARDLQVAGVDHVEFSSPDIQFAVAPIKRWRFAGNAVFTVASLSSFERDRIYDEIIRDFSFDRRTNGGMVRRYIEGNPYLGLDFDWDRISTSGTTSSPGTPWGTDDVIYETTIRMQCQGEFVSELSSGSLLPLEEVALYPYRHDEPDPIPTGDWV